MLTGDDFMEFMYAMAKRNSPVEVEGETISGPAVQKDMDDALVSEFTERLLKRER